MRMHARGPGDLVNGDVSAVIFESGSEGAAFI